MFSMFNKASSSPDGDAMSVVDHLDLRIAGMIDVDATFFIQFGIFVFLIIAMKVLVYDPFLSLQDRRDRATGGAISEAKEAGKTVERLKTQLEDGLSQARARGTQIRDELRAEAETQTQSEVDVVSAEMSAMVEAELATLKGAEADARSQIDVEATRIASVLADRIMGVSP
jgi:F-type H+-transporting ATPase subunit b